MISMIAVVLIVVGTVLFSMLYTISVQPKTLSLRVGTKAYRRCGVIRSAAIVFELMTLGGYVLFPLGSTFNFKLTVGSSIAVRIAGGVFAALCLSFMTYATLKAGGESAVPNELTELHHGIYDYMRHPQTLGEMLSWFGISMVLNSLTLLVYSIVWLPLFIGFTVIEDNDLAVRFGDAYVDYTRRVGMFWKRRTAA